MLFVDDDTIRDWVLSATRKMGSRALTIFDHEGGACRLAAAEREQLKAWIGETLPCFDTRDRRIDQRGNAALNTKAAPGWSPCCIVWASNIASRRRISRGKLDPVKQAAFITAYENLLNQLPADEVVMFGDARCIRPMRCARSAAGHPKVVRVAVEQSSGRDRLNVHGAIDLDDRQDRHAGRADCGCREHHLAADGDRGDVPRQAAGPSLPGQCQIPSRGNWCRHGWQGQSAGSGFDFIPAYCPHLNPIERLWGLRHRHITHNKCYASFRDFSIAMLTFLRCDDVPRNWDTYCDRVTDNFRNHQPKGFSGSHVSGRRYI